MRKARKDKSVRQLPLLSVQRDTSSGSKVSRLATQRGTAAAYDRMVGAISQYGADRATLDVVASRNPNVAALMGKFEKGDAEIGKAASMLPSRSDGKSVMDDLGEKLKQVLDRAVEAVKSVFNPGAERGPRASASPSP